MSEVSEVAQSLSSLQPRGLYPTRLLCPWDSPGKNTGVGHVWQKPLQYCKVISLQLIKIKGKKKYWSGLPFPSPGDLPNPGIEPRSPSLQADTLTSEPLSSMCKMLFQVLKIHVVETVSNSWLCPRAQYYL